jgi:hypothetical protein
MFSNSGLSQFEGYVCTFKLIDVMKIQSITLGVMDSGPDHFTATAPKYLSASPPH